MDAIDQFAVNIVVSVAVKELSTYGTDLNPAQTEAKVHTVLTDTIHETWLEGTVEAAADAVIEALPVICKNADAVKGIVDDAASGQWPAALTAFKALVVKTLPANGEFTPELTQLLTAA